MNNDNKNDTIEPVISEKKIYTGKFINLTVQTVETGSGYSQRELVVHPGTVSLILITDYDRLVMSRIYRKSVERYSLEVLTKRISSAENHFDIIKDDLTSNVGYKVEEIKPVFTFYNAISYSNENVFMYLAKAKKIGEGDENEEAKIVEVPISKLSEPMYKDEIIDAKSIIAVGYLQMQYKKD